jgi:hypothetical protein
MTTLLEKRLTDAMKQDINTYTWKGAKVLNSEGVYEQTEEKLINMSVYNLRNCYQHCIMMLFNKDSRNPGRYLVLDMIEDQINRCGVELFLRYLEKEHDSTRSALISIINKFLSANKEVFKDTIPVLSHMYSGLPKEFEELSINLVLDGCLDKLGAIVKKHITRTFILKQGLWLTAAEVKDFPAKDPKERLELIRETLGLKEVEKLYINSRGINYTQMRAMLNLKPNKKYRDLTTVQLETLRYRILHELKNSINIHISFWEKRMEEIEEVAEYNKIDL